MRTLTASFTLAIATMALMPLRADAADTFPPVYGKAPPPPPVAYVAPPPYYAPLPVYGYAPNTVYVRPGGIIAVPEGPAYAVPGPVYQPGDEYLQGPVLVDATRYYRKCWWEWGYTRCVLRPRW